MILKQKNVLLLFKNLNKAITYYHQCPGQREMILKQQVDLSLFKNLNKAITNYDQCPGQRERIFKERVDLSLYPGFHRTIVTITVLNRTKGSFAEGKVSLQLGEVFSSDNDISVYIMYSYMY